MLDLVTLTYRAKCIGPQLTFIVYHKWVLDFIPLGYSNVSNKVYQSQSEQPPKCIEPNLRWGQAGLKGHQSEVWLRRGPRHLSIYIGINACVTNAGQTNAKPGKIGLLTTRPMDAVWLSFAAKNSWATNAFLDSELLWRYDETESAPESEHLFSFETL